MELLDSYGGYALAAIAGSMAVVGTLFVWIVIHRPTFPKNAPRLLADSFPAFAPVQFFTQRWDFLRAASAHSQTGNFSFYVGKYPVVSINGRKPELRKIFFESKSLGFTQGYSTLLAAAPEVKSDGNPLADNVTGASLDFRQYFHSRLLAMLKGNRLGDNLPDLFRDACSSLDSLAADSKGLTDPFDSIYRMVFLFTMRTVAANEIADSPELLEKVLLYFEEIETAHSRLEIVFPWLPHPNRIRRTYAGYQLFKIFKKVKDSRVKEDRREDDALQYLIDKGDDLNQMIGFVITALFAGQLNSGINAAWIIIYLARDSYWQNRVREEVNSVADRYCPDRSLPLKERLMQVPIKAWESEFPIIDMCLKDSIRLTIPGSGFRRNITNQDIPLDKEGKEVIPAGAYVALPFGHIHYNSDIYSNESNWDPSRYMPDRAEDKKEEHGWFGWGLARYPCLGMRFAKLENNLIVAFFLAYFDDFTLTDAEGNPTTRVPTIDRNDLTAKKPTERAYVKYHAAKN